MLTIRLSRTGKRHTPQYRIVVQEKTQDPWAPAKEIVGHYNPHTSPSTIELKEDRIKEWLEKGAQPSETVHNMLVNAGIIKAEKAPVVTISNKRQTKLDEKKAEAEEKAAAEKAEAEAQETENSTQSTEAAPEAPAEEKAEAPAEEQKEETPAEGAEPAEAVEAQEESAKEEAPAEESAE